MFLTGEFLAFFFYTADGCWRYFRPVDLKKRFYMDIHKGEIGYAAGTIAGMAFDGAGAFTKLTNSDAGALA